MPDHRMPKTSLFSWLPHTRPFCGPKRQWRDVIKEDLNFLEVTVERWDKAAQNRKAWYEICSKGGIEHQLKQDKTWGQQQGNRDIHVECSK